MSYSDAEIWVIIALMGAGTYLIRFSFLGVIGNRPIPPVILRLLRYTPVAVLPGMVAPLVLWPAATGGAVDLTRLLAAGVAVAIGVTTRNVIWAICGGIGSFYLALWLNGALG